MIERDVTELKARVAKLEHTLALLQRHLGITLPDAPLPGGVSPEVLALVRKADKLGAIRLHMQQTGANMQAAKALVDTLE